MMKEKEEKKEQKDEDKFGEKEEKEAKIQINEIKNEEIEKKQQKNINCSNNFASLMSSKQIIKNMSSSFYFILLNITLKMFNTILLSSTFRSKILKLKNDSKIKHESFLFLLLIK